MIDDCKVIVKCDPVDEIITALAKVIAVHFLVLWDH